MTQPTAPEITKMIRTTNGYEINVVRPVETVDFMGDDNAVCDAARVSFNKDSTEYSAEANQRLIRYLAKHDHWSPFAHCSLKFRFKAPMFVARQFQKHVVGFAWNEVSRRYVDESPTFYVPESWRQRPDNMKQGSVNEGEVELTHDVLDAYMGQMREHHKDYKSMIHQGICPEQVRMCMPQAMMTEWIWTGSLMAWARFVQLRADSHAQQECWLYAEQVRDFMERYFPASTEALLGD
jgi:thymidylate synthase (FAD)